MRYRPRSLLTPLARAALVSVLPVLALWLPSQASAGIVTAGFGTDLEVRGTFSSINETGQSANDFHFKACTAEGNANPPAGASAESSSFPGGNGAMGVNGCVNFEFRGAEVAAGETISFDVSFFLDKQNSTLIKDKVWTKDGVPTGSGGAGSGWSVTQPLGGGTGGITTLGGGGQGGQQGGGGTGKYVHKFEVFNLGDTDRVLAGLKLLASVNFFDSLVNDVPWQLVDLFDEATGFVVPAKSSAVFSFNTTGSYDNGGHVYSRFSFADAPTENVFGDHPVEPLPVPPSVSLVLAGLALLARGRWARRSSP